LGLFQLLASKPSMSVVTQLRRSLLSSFETVQIMAVKATFDVLLWCGAASLDRVMGIGIDLAPVSEPSKAGVQVSSFPFRRSNTS
jgi:hypothetical protein